MIARPLHTVNAPLGAVPSIADVSSALGTDLSVSAANVARWGGDAARYAAALAAAAGAAAAPVDPLATGAGTDPADVRALAAVAAWRSGVLGLRDEALRLLGDPTGLGRRPALAGAVLGLPADQVPSFVAAQASDRFAWPVWNVPHEYLLARVGGFTGLGGPWRRAPVQADPEAPGRWRVRTGDGAEWIVGADLFGDVVVPADGAAPAVEPTSAERATARAVTSDASYLLDLVHRVG